MEIAAAAAVRRTVARFDSRSASSSHSWCVAVSLSDRSASRKRFRTCSFSRSSSTTRASRSAERCAGGASRHGVSSAIGVRADVPLRHFTRAFVADSREDRVPERRVRVLNESREVFFTEKTIVFAQRRVFGLELRKVRFNRANSSVFARVFARRFTFSVFNSFASVVASMCIDLRSSSDLRKCSVRLSATSCSRARR